MGKLTGYFEIRNQNRIYPGYKAKNKKQKPMIRIEIVVSRLVKEPISTLADSALLMDCKILLSGCNL
jgi:hypothetical protein